jgi:hypothetical protein
MNETLKDILERFQHLSDYAETKLGTLIALNSAIIFGLLSIYTEQTTSTKYGIIYVLFLNASSLFFAFSGVYAKRKNKNLRSKISEPKNYFYYKYVAHLTETSFLEEFKIDYKFSSQNQQLEKDLANQIVYLAQNADRKFRFFNIALGFTIASLITPIGLLAFHFYNNPNWQFGA